MGLRVYDNSELGLSRGILYWYDVRRSIKIRQQDGVARIAASSLLRVEDWDVVIEGKQSRIERLRRLCSNDHRINALCSDQLRTIAHVIDR